MEFIPDPFQVQGGSYVRGAERSTFIEVVGRHIIDQMQGRCFINLMKQQPRQSIKDLLIVEKAKKEMFYFITINPITGDFDVFKDKVTRLVKRPFLIDPIYAFEQRGKTMDEIGKGYHIHIISKKKKYTSPAELKKNIFSQFKDILGNVKHIDIRVCPSDWYDDKIQYLKGIKWDDDKSASCDLNRVWRENLKLKTFYI